MSASRILRVQVLDSPDFVVLRSQSDGPSPLDLKLTATDEEAAFKGHVRQSTHLKLKSQAAHDDEWTSSLIAALGPARDTQAIADNEMVARVGSEGITLVVRKNVQGITQRLGEILIPRDDTVEIRLFEWAAQAASTADQLQVTLADLQTEMQKQRQSSAKLQTLIQDLTAAKSEDEDALIQKFVQLLNAKKSKIRDQQRLLACAKIDPDTAAKVSSARQTTQRRYAHDSGPLKRKADAASSSEDEQKSLDDDSDNGVETPRQETGSDLDDVLLADRSTTKPTRQAHTVPSMPAEHNSSPQPSSSAVMANNEGDDETDDEL